MSERTSPCKPKPIIQLSGLAEKNAVINFSPRLARQIGGRNGDRLAILLIQINYWISHDTATYFKEGHWWFAISAAEIHRRLHQWLSPSTLAVLLQALKVKHLILLEPGKRASDPYAIALDVEGCRKLGIAISETQTPEQADFQNSEMRASEIRKPVELVMAQNGSDFQVSESIENSEDDDQQNSVSTLDHHPDAHTHAGACDPQEAAFMLMAVGLNGQDLQAAIEAVQIYGLTRAKIHTAIQDAQAGKRLEEMGSKRKVSVIPAYVKACILKNSISTTYLDLEAEQQAALETKRQAEAEEAARDAYLNSPEYLAERQARETALQQAYQRELAAFDALLKTYEKIKPWSFWWKAWQRTLGQLQVQLHRASYNTWIAGAEAVAYDTVHHTLIVKVLDKYDKDWLEQRLYRLVQGSLGTVSGQRDVAVRFVVAPQEPRPFAFKPLPEGLPGFTDKAS